MRLKLDHAQAVLRALALEDYPALERAATELGALTNSAAWGVLKTPEYRRHSADFLRETDEPGRVGPRRRPERRHARLRLDDRAVRAVPPTREGCPGGRLRSLGRRITYEMPQIIRMEKLTLSVDGRVVQRAKRYTAAQGTRFRAS